MVLQNFSLLAIWLAYGYVLWRQSGAKRPWALSLSRKFRVACGVLLLFGGATLMLASLLGVQALGGATKEGLTWWAYGAIALLGLVFVHMQALAATFLASLVHENVTGHLQGPSTKVETDSEKE
jgi:hypothetical protein